MKRSLPFSLVLLLAAALTAAPGWAQRPPRSSLNHIQVAYNGGPLLQNVEVVTLFWGPDWKSNALPDYFNGFFKALFTDGRFMANLAQYSAGGYTIGNGTLASTGTDDQAPPSPVHDAEIQAEIQAQIAAGHLPAPDANTVYFVFTPPQIDVIDPSGHDSFHTFTGYHYFVTGSGGFPYAVIPYDDTLSDPHEMTHYASHELAEAVTDPEPGDTTLGWYDNNNGEIGDIPVSLFAARRISESGLVDQLNALDGTVYLVQKVWSNQANAPVAFAPVAGP